MKPGTQLRKSISILLQLTFLAGLYCVAVPTWANDLPRIVGLVRGGAPNLALRVLNKSQPPVQNYKQWIAYEKQRFAIYRQQQAWKLIISRCNNLPSGISDEFVRWANMQAALAALQAEQPAQARKFLRHIVWQPKSSVAQRARGRRLVIRSYLLEKRVDDALVALQRYKLDHNARSNAWQLLHATVLLQAGKNKDAFAVLAGIQTYKGRILRLLAGMRAGIYRPIVVLIQADKLAHILESKPKIQYLAWHLLAEAALKSSNYEKRIVALESALALQQKPNMYSRQMSLNADALWRSYFVLAEGIGNDQGLLIGDDDAWMKKAKSFADSEKARAFYAFMAFKARQSENKISAHKTLANILFEQGKVNALIALYTKSSQFKDLDVFPAGVRFRLANVALRRYSIKLAAKLMKGVTEPPKGEDRVLWDLRQARILIYAGDYSTAIRLLKMILNETESIPETTLARYVQVMFDLQAAGKNKEAYTLLKRIYKLSKDKNRHREILFWMADSKYAEKQYVQAAELYLQSATLTVPNGGDIWGQTARYKAAEALGLAGLVVDARNVYLKLLRGTGNAKRRALIERNIQQLWLHQKHSTRK